jgi:hypothetical protein
MLGERNEGFISTGEMEEQPEERVEGATSIAVTDKQISIEEVPVAVPQEEKLPEQVQVQQEPKISKRKQKRRITSYLSNISKQVEKNGNQINKITMMVQSIQKQKQTKSTKGPGVSQSPLQLIKQIQSQVNQLQKQVSRIQIDVQKIRVTAAATKSGFRKPTPPAATRTTVKPRPRNSNKKQIRLTRSKVSRGRKK